MTCACQSREQRIAGAPFEAKVSLVVRLDGGEWHAPCSSCLPTVFRAIADRLELEREPTWAKTVRRSRPWLFLLLGVATGETLVLLAQAWERTQ